MVANNIVRNHFSMLLIFKYTNWKRRAVCVNTNGMRSLLSGEVQDYNSAAVHHASWYYLGPAFGIIIYRW